MSNSNFLVCVPRHLTILTVNMSSFSGQQSRGNWTQDSQVLAAYRTKKMGKKKRVLTKFFSAKLGVQHVESFKGCELENKAKMDANKLEGQPEANILLPYQNITRCSHLCKA